jgi:hypothetical protein
MAQQAKPNSMYHCEDALPQLRSSSTFVVKTVSGKLFINGIGSPIYKLLTKKSLPQDISIDDLNLIGKYIQSETVVPMNIYEVTTKVLDFVMDGPFSGRANHALVALDIADATAFHSL